MYTLATLHSLLPFHLRSAYYTPLVIVFSGESHIRSEHGKYPEFDYNIHGNNTCILDGI